MSGYTEGVRWLVPLVIVLLLGYGNFVLGYCLGYREIYIYHSHAAAIALWVLLGLCQILFFAYWFLILYIGPGKVPTYTPFDLQGEQPPIFNCDQYGYPLYSSQSSSILPPRTFYLKYSGYHVSKYDHYCIWINSVIGQTNYIFFIKFVFWFWGFFTLLLVYICRYFPSNLQQDDGADPNFIPGVIFAGFWFLILTGFMIVNLRSISKNSTTLDEITKKQHKMYLDRKLEIDQEQPVKRKGKKLPRKEDGIRYVNVGRNGTRLIISYSINDDVYNLGFKKNWINFVFNGNRSQDFDGEYDNLTLFKAFAVMVVPFTELFYRKRGEDTFDSYSNIYSIKFINYINQKAESRECYIALYIPRESEQSESAESKTM